MVMPALRSEVKLSLILLFWAIFGMGYFSRFPLPSFWSRLYFIALALVVTGSACGFGSLGLRRCAPAGFWPSEFFVFSTVAGFGVFSLLMVLTGVLGLWTQPAAIILISIGLLLGWFNLRRLPPRSLGGSTSSKMMDSGSRRAGISLLFPFCLIAIGATLSLAMAFCPVTYYDSLVYHFALPQAYIQAGRWVGQRQLIYSAFPQAMEMIWTLSLLLAGDVLANLLGWIVGALGVWAVYNFAKRYFGNRTAAWAAAFLSVMPAYVLLISGGYVDVGLAVFSFMSFYALCLWRDHQEPRVLALAGAFAGCAVGTKYTGSIPLVLGTFFILKGVHSRTLKNLTVQELIYLGPAFFVMCPWFLKNLHYFGNPIFPFCYSWTTKALNPWVSTAAAGYFARGLTEYAPRSGWHLFKLLWDIAVNGFNFGGGMDVLGDLGWAPFFAFLPAIWLAKNKSPTLVRVLLYSVLFFIPWGMARPVLRFLIPLAPFLALAAAYGYEEGLNTQAKGYRWFGHVFLVLMLLSNAQLFFVVGDVLSVFRVPLGFESRREYLSEKVDYFDAAAFVNTLPQDSLTYVVGDQRGYYYNKPVLVTPVFSTNPLTDWANHAASAEDLASRLKAEHITHILINHSEFKRLDGVYHLFPFTAKGQANWDVLRSHLAKTLYEDRHCEVLALGSGGGR